MLKRSLKFLSPGSARVGTRELGLVFGDARRGTLLVVHLAHLDPDFRIDRVLRRRRRCREHCKAQEKCSRSHDVASADGAGD